MSGNPLVQIIIAVAVLIAAWVIVEYFSPHPLITMLCKILIFVLALLLIVQKVLPLVGVHV